MKNNILVTRGKLFNISFLLWENQWIFCVNIQYHEIHTWSSLNAKELKTFAQNAQNTHVDLVTTWDPCAHVATVLFVFSLVNISFHYITRSWFWTIYKTRAFSREKHRWWSWYFGLLLHTFFWEQFALLPQNVSVLSHTSPPVQTLHTWGQRPCHVCLHMVPVCLACSWLGEGYGALSPLMFWHSWDGVKFTNLATCHASF